jgi:hypothetical protein
VRHKSVLVGLLLTLAGAAVFAQGPLTPSAAVTSTVYNGTTPLVPLYCVIDEATSGQNVVVAASSGNKIRFLAGHLTMTGTAVTITFQNGVAGTALTGAMGPAAGQTIVWPFNPVGYFETTTGQALQVALSGAQSIDGSCVYVLIAG